MEAIVRRSIKKKLTKVVFVRNNISQNRKSHAEDRPRDPSGHFLKLEKGTPEYLSFRFKKALKRVQKLLMRKPFKRLENVLRDHQAEESNICFQAAVNKESSADDEARNGRYS